MLCLASNTSCALVDLQGDADVTGGEQRFEVRLCGGEQGLTGALFTGSLRPRPMRKFRYTKA